MASWLSTGDSDLLSSFSRAARSFRRSQRVTGSPTTMLGLCRPAPSKPPPAYPFADQATGPGSSDGQSISSSELYNLRPSLLLQRVQSLVNDDDGDYDSDDNISVYHAAAVPLSHDTTSQSSAHSTSSSNPSLHHIPRHVVAAGPVHPSPPLLPPRIEPLKEVLAGYLDLIKLLQETAAVRSSQSKRIAESSALRPRNNQDTHSHHAQDRRPLPMLPMERQLTLIPDDCSSAAMTPAGSFEHLELGTSRSPSPTVGAPPWVRGASQGSRRRLLASARRLKLSESTLANRQAGKSRSERITPTAMSTAASTYDAPCGGATVYRVKVEHSPGSLGVGSSMIVRLGSSYLGFAQPNGHEVLRVPYSAIRRYGNDATSVKVDVGSALPQATGLYVLQCHTPVRVLQALCRSIEMDALRVGTASPTFI